MPTIKELETQYGDGFTPETWKLWRKAVLETTGNNRSVFGTGALLESALLIGNLDFLFAGSPKNLADVLNYMNVAYLTVENQIRSQLNFLYGDPAGVVNTPRVSPDLPGLLQGMDHDHRIHEMRITPTMVLHRVTRASDSETREILEGIPGFKTDFFIRTINAPVLTRRQLSPAFSF